MAQVTHDGTERKTTTLRIRCTPSTKRAFRVMVAELEKTAGDVIEVCVQAYKISPAIFDPKFI